MNDGPYRLRTALFYGYSFVLLVLRILLKKNQRFKSFRRHAPAIGHFFPFLSNTSTPSTIKQVYWAIKQRNFALSVH